MIRRPFEQWLFEDVEIAFNIERIDNLLVLVEWLDVPKNNILSSEIDKLRVLLSKNVETWNESDLEMMFLAQFLGQFEFNNALAYRVFMQRNLFTEEGLEENHKAKWFIATGKQTPKKTVFLFAGVQTRKKIRK